MATPEIQLVWFKRDLRLQDHRPLSEAAQRGPVLCLYVYEPEVYQAADASPAHQVFISQSLAELRAGLRELGSELYLFQGEITEALNHIAKVCPIAALWSHEETGNGITYQRDLQVADWCQAKGIPWTEYWQNGVIRRLRSRDGWADRWIQRMRLPQVETPGSLRTLPPSITIPAGEILWEADLGLPKSRMKSAQKGGSSLALAELDSFLSYRGVNYRKDMSSPVEGWEGCSRLSPYLSWGCISMRQVYQAAQQRSWEVRDLVKGGAEIDKRWAGSLQSFLGRLRWHCHFMQKLEDEPEIEDRNFNRAYDGLRESEWNEEWFEAWCKGETGYPMVDACMRCLHETGWINFRMRAMLVSFFAYHLWLHWKRPAEYLAQLFLDYEPGIHYSQVQMQSGTTGINSIRIYSPIKQVSDQDPKGIFIRRWVPELESVPEPYLAQPHTLPELEQAMAGIRIGNDYPAPIVDHRTAYQAARTRIYQRKGSIEARQTAQKVQQKHGSRRSGIPQVRNPT